MKTLKTSGPALRRALAPAVLAAFFLTPFAAGAGVVFTDVVMDSNATIYGPSGDSDREEYRGPAMPAETTLTGSVDNAFAEVRVGFQQSGPTASLSFAFDHRYAGDNVSFLYGGTDHAFFSVDVGSTYSISGHYEVAGGSRSGLPSPWGSTTTPPIRLSCTAITTRRIR